MKLPVAFLSLPTSFSSSFIFIFQEVSRHVSSAYSGKLGRHSFSSRLQTAVEAIALCHNVTPINDGGKLSYQAASPDEVCRSWVTKRIKLFKYLLHVAAVVARYKSFYQVALVEWTESVGVRLSQRDLTSIQLQLTNGQTRSFQILHLFPFTSETKRMGIIVKVSQ